ncbi:MAG: hypothetical protein ACTSR4_07220 [Candidatus Hodarchaeales archaeon]
MAKKLTFAEITNYILIAIPLAMGIATVVLSVISMINGEPSPDMSFALGLGLASLAVYSLDALDTKDES